MKTNINNLPNELLVMIFGYFHNTQLAKFELTCKRWQDLIRNTAALWKDCFYLDETSRICTTKVVERIKLYQKRSQGQEETNEIGQLNSISIPIYLDTVDDEEHSDGSTFLTIDMKEGYDELFSVTSAHGRRTGLVPWKYSANSSTLLKAIVIAIPRKLSTGMRASRYA